MKHIVAIKVGTSTLFTHDDTGKLTLDVDSFENISSQILQLQAKGYGIVIISSGAVAAGRTALNTNAQANKGGLASIGWRHILNAWSDCLGEVGGLLVTRHDLDETGNRIALINTIHNLLDQNVVVVINENDAVTDSYAVFGDNDTLAAILAAQLNASSLIILSDIHGVYEDVGDASTVIRRIEDDTMYRHVINAQKSRTGTGGMATKFVAAGIAQRGSVDMYIAHGRAANVLDKALKKQIGTHFVARAGVDQ